MTVSEPTTPVSDEAAVQATTGTCVCTCGKPYPCDEDPHQWEPGGTP